MHNLFEERVSLNHESHVYTHMDGRIFTSVSKVLGTIKEKFDENGQITYATAKSRGVSREQVQAEWAGKGKEATDHGTNIHEALERYEKTAKINAQDEHLRPMLMAVNAEYKDYYRVHSEMALYDEEYEIAGTSDHVLETTRHKNSIIDIDDYKTNISKGIYYTNPYKKYLLRPFNHVMESNYYLYSLQVSSYAFMVEKLTGRKIGRLSIVFISPNNPLAYKRIPCAYLKNDVKILFDYHKELKHIKKEEGILDIFDTEVLPTFN